jgi:hypothetical protein
LPVAAPMPKAKAPNAVPSSAWFRHWATNWPTDTPSARRCPDGQHAEEDRGGDAERADQRTVTHR